MERDRAEIEKAVDEAIDLRIDDKWSLFFLKEISEKEKVSYSEVCRAAIQAFFSDYKKKERNEPDGLCEFCPEKAVMTLGRSCCPFFVCLDCWELLKDSDEEEMTHSSICLNGLKEATLDET